MAAEVKQAAAGQVGNEVKVCKVCLYSYFDDAQI